MDNYIDLNKNNKVNTIKFNTCKHRSVEEITRQARSCCKSSTQKGFLCNKLKIFGLKPEICQNCNLFEGK